MSEIQVWKIAPLNMVTTSERERDKWIAAGHEVVEFVSIDRIKQLEQELAEAKAALAAQAQQESQWISVEEGLPAYGQIVDLSINGVLQNETYEIDATDNDLYLTHFWTRDGLDDGLDIEQGQFWRARLPMPKPLPPAPKEDKPSCRQCGAPSGNSHCLGDIFNCSDMPAPEGGE